MNSNKSGQYQKGGLRGGLILWLLGVPLPLILLFYFLGGC